MVCTHNGGDFLQHGSQIVFLLCWVVAKIKDDRVGDFNTDGNKL